MKEIFAISYALLCGLVVLQAIVLRDILRRTLWFKRLTDGFSRRGESETQEPRPTGVPAPDFTATLLSTGELWSSSQLKGHFSILLFVSPETPSPHYEKIAIAMHAMWHEAGERLYLVCNGSPESCRQFTRIHRIEGLGEDQIQVLLDEGGQIAQSFLIDSAPQAVSLGEDLRVRRYGRPMPSEEASADAAESDQIKAKNGEMRETSGGSNLEAERLNEETPISKARRSAGGKDGEPCEWPDTDPSTGAAFARMDTTVSCLLTRFRLRSAWSLIPFYLAFRRVRRNAQSVSGLLQAVFLIEDLHTCYTMSFWKDECAIVRFSNIGAHIRAANSAFGPTYRRDLNRAEIWSAQFRLWGVSCHNLNWEGFDLQPILADQWERREEVARPRAGEKEVLNG
jgi:hypothetical protein